MFAYPTGQSIRPSSIVILSSLLLFNLANGDVGWLFLTY